MATKVAVRILPDQPRYWPNQSVTLYAEFRDVESNELTDPADVELRIVTGSGIELSYTFEAAEVSTQGTGLYSKEIEVTEPYTWKFKWQGTGGASSSAAGVIEIGVDVDPTGAAPTFPDPGAGDDGKIARAASGVWTPYGSVGSGSFLRGDGTGGWESRESIGIDGVLSIDNVRAFMDDYLVADASAVGLVLTNGVNGALVVDGVTMSVGEYIGTTYRWTESSYPVAIVTAAGSGSTPWVLTFLDTVPAPALVAPDEGGAHHGDLYFWANTLEPLRKVRTQAPDVIFSEGFGGGVTSPSGSSESDPVTLPGAPYGGDEGFVFTATLVFLPSAPGHYNLTARLLCSVDNGDNYSQVGIASFIQEVTDVSEGATYQVSLVGKQSALSSPVPILLKGSLVSAGTSVDDVNWLNLFLHGTLGKMSVL